MVFSEESTVGAFLLRARREGLRDFGASMSPHTAWLILQGIETLSLRMERHMANTVKVVAFLAAHPFVSRVGHPMLEGHPSHSLAARLLPRGAGSVFSFDMKGSREQGKKFIDALKVFSHLANVGDCRSLVIHPASTGCGRNHPGHDPPVDRAGGRRRPDRRPQARAEGGGENMSPHVHLRSLPPEGAQACLEAARRRLDMSPHVPLRSPPPEGAHAWLEAARREAT
jgi:hypothetical protein